MPSSILAFPRHPTPPNFKMFPVSCSLLAALGLLPLALAQSFIPQPQNTTTLASRVLPGATLSYKPNTLCSDTPSYAGYVTLPILTAAEPYNASLFYWYFPATNNPATAPTTLWLPGGPATSFLDGSSGFPCAVGADGNSTTRNAFALNTYSNMLYVDAPVQAGYSYAGGGVVNGLFDVAQNIFTPAADGAESVVINASTTVASMGGLSDTAHTANTTAQVAAQVWAFAQVWLQEFPHQATAAAAPGTTPRLNLWSYSYSGFFGAASAAYVTAQNARIAAGEYEVAVAGVAAPVEIELGTLGINNGCVDIESQLASFPEMMVRNSYGIQAVPEAVYEEARELVEACYGLVAECRALAAERDPEGTGNVEAVNAVCVNTTTTCFDGLLGLYLESNVSLSSFPPSPPPFISPSFFPFVPSNTHTNTLLPADLDQTDGDKRSQFDLALPLPGMWAPFGAPAAFYNQRWVQEALGVPVNFTLSADTVVENFFAATGDPMIPTYKALETILDAGVGVAFVYGDRDYQCNCESSYPQLSRKASFLHHP